MAAAPNNRLEMVLSHKAICQEKPALRKTKKCSSVQHAHHIPKAIRKRTVCNKDAPKLFKRFEERVVNIFGAAG